MFQTVLLICPPTCPLRTIICTSSNLHYIRKLSWHVNLSLVKIGPVVLVMIFKWPHPIFTFLWLPPLWSGLGPLIWRHLISLHPTISCTKFDLIWSPESGEDFKKFLSVFLLISYYLPLERGYPQASFEQTWIPWFVPSLVKIDSMVL
jgi:hypothetical protein